MQFTRYKPHAPLSAHVDYFWEVRDAPAHARERILPTGTMEMVVNLAEDEVRVWDPTAGPGCQRFPGAIVSGCYGEAFEVDNRENACVVGVHFRPGGAAGVFAGLPGEIAGSHVALSDVWGGAANQLRERLTAEPDTRRRFAILERTLTGFRLEAPPDHGVIGAALAALERPSVEVGEVARRLGLSQRYFIEVFRRAVGMAPKRYSRVRRFQRAVALAGAGPSTDWAEVALAAGYFDQAHLCRDWRRFTGFSPAAQVALLGPPATDHHVAGLARARVNSVQDA